MFAALSAGLALFAFALTVSTGLHWIGHALVGMLSLAFAISAAISGAARAGRIGVSHGASLVGAHQKIALYLDVFVVCSFFLGLWSRLYMGEPPFWLVPEPLNIVVHGWFGLIVTILAIAQVLTCLLIKRKIVPIRIHKFFGYPLAGLLLIQAVLGIDAALF